MAIKDMRLPSISFLPTKPTTTTTTNNIFKTLNSVYFDSSPEVEQEEQEEEEEEDEDIESIIRGAHTESRLFFEPSTAKSISLTNQNKGMMRPPFKESVAKAMETDDPYRDFRESMEEMVMTHDLIKKEWGCLEELLAWYLSVNRKTNHAYIVAAFVDLLVKISSSSSEEETPLNEGCFSSSNTSRRSSSSSSSPASN